MIDLKISKELINQVYPVILEALGDSYKAAIIEDTIDFCQNSKVIINYNLLFSSNGEQQFELSLESFAFKCKEWAYENFKIMLISHYSGQCYINGDLSPLVLNWWNNTKSYQVESDTEIEAIIKACEWILEQTK